jgi:hypothetical protein
MVRTHNVSPTVVRSMNRHAGKFPPYSKRVAGGASEPMPCSLGYPTDALVRIADGHPDHDVDQLQPLAYRGQSRKAVA